MKTINKSGSKFKNKQLQPNIGFGALKVKIFELEQIIKLCQIKAVSQIFQAKVIFKVTVLHFKVTKQDFFVT